MTALVVGAAPALEGQAFYRGLLRDAEHVVAADAAGEWCVSLGRVPDVVVGDFDSAAVGAAERLTALGCEVLRVPERKDETDLELAVRLALERFGAPLTVTCAFSRRMDHTLASFGAVLSAGPGAMAREPQWTAWAVQPDAPVSVELERGRRFSVLVTGRPGGVTVTGGRWRLEEEDLPPLSGRGVSNMASGGRVQVSCREGSALVMVCDQE